MTEEHGTRHGIAAATVCRSMRRVDGTGLSRARTDLSATVPFRRAARRTVVATVRQRNSSGTTARRDRTKGWSSGCPCEPVNRAPIRSGDVERLDRLGGLIHEYRRAA
jgi:hypothetical protein